MIQCKANNPLGCDKVCCCLECGDINVCTNVCTILSPTCPDAQHVPEPKNGTELAKLETEARVVIRQIAEIATQKKKLDEQEKGLKEELRQAMEAHGVKSFENALVKFTYIAPTTETRLDAKRLREELPNVYECYSKTSKKASYVKITVK